MNKKSGSGSGPFLMEMLIVVGFFIICASICVLVFVRADNISKDARDINRAVLEAQSLAEMMKAGKDPQWSEMMPEKDIWSRLSGAPDDNSGEDGLEEIKKAADYDGLRAVYWDSGWQIMEPNSAPDFLGVIARGTVDGIEKADIRVYRYGNGKGKLIFRLNTETYQKSPNAYVMDESQEDGGQAPREARRLAQMILAGKVPPWSKMLPSRDVWSVIADGEPQDKAMEDMLEEIRKAPDYDGLRAVYWDSNWQVILPCTSPDYLGIIEKGNVDGQAKADICIYRYGQGDDRGELLCHINTDAYQQP